MGFSAGLGCGGDSWVVLSWWLENCLLLLLCYVAVIVGKRGNPNKVKSHTREKKRDRERWREKK